MYLDTDQQGGQDKVRNGANPHEQSAYEYGQRHSRPPLSEAAVILGSYTCDSKPADFDNQCLVRSAEPPIASETIRCSVQGSFIDSSVFTDTNILLEILQNAEPKDSKGTWFGLEFLAAGEWRPVVEEIDKFKDSEIEAVRISDNGKGYMPKDMTTLGGAKRSDRESAGRFGSGMKVSDRSALGKNVQVKRFSRNWRATPYLEPVLTSAGWDNTVSYDVEYLASMHQGSIVEYKNPTPEMLGALREIEEIYLPLDRTFRERLLAETNMGLLLKPRGENGGVMVNGRKYTLTVAPRYPLLFSYDLQDVSIDDQNRHYVDAAKAAVNIVQIWSELRDPNLFQELVNAAQNNQEIYELEMPGMWKVPDCFLEVLRKTLEVKNFDLVYLKDAELGGGDEQVLKRRGYKCVNNKLAKHRFFAETFKNMGVLPGKELIDKVTERFYGERIEPYKGETFISSVCKGIVGVKNLQSFNDDQKEIVVCLRDEETGEEREVVYSEFLRNKPPANLRPVMLVCRIKNDHLKTNQDWLAAKDRQVRSSELASRFKNFLAACSVTGVNASVMNGNLELNPEQTTSHSHYTIYKVRNWQNFPLENLEVRIYLDNASQINEISEIGKYSLDMDPDYQPVVKTPYGDIVSLSEGLVYDQGIKDTHSTLGNILSYNFTSERKTGEGERNIRDILNLAEDASVAKTVLEKAQEVGSEVSFPEYGFWPRTTEVQTIWKRAFEEVFGADTVIDDSHDVNPKSRCNDLITDVREKSGIKKISLHPNLNGSLVACGVKTLPKAVRAKRIIEYAPNPLQEVLLMVDKIADRALEVSLPPEVIMVKPAIRTAKAIYNEYGQAITGGYGYLDPTLRDPTIYVFDEGIQQSKISNLLTFILQKRIEAHRDQMDQDEYIEFKAAVMAIAERSLTSLEFLRKVRLTLFRKREKVVELVNRVVQDIPREEEDNQSKAFRLKPKQEKGPRSMQGLNDALKSMGGPVGRTAAAVACAALVLTGGGFAVKKLAETGWFKSAAAYIAQKTQGGGFNRSWRNRDSEVGVSIGRTGESTERHRLTREQASMQRASFISVPELAWGTFLNESPLNKYNGKGWSTDLKAPDFKNPGFPNATRIAHMQRISPDQRTVFLRPLSGGYIDPASIIFHKEDGSDVRGMLMTPGIYGSYEIDIGNQGDIVAVSYHNLMPAGWMEKAEKLTDKDFEELPRDAYGYHTQTPNLDLSKIRFSSPAFPQAQNLQEFVSYLRTITPLQRLSLIHTVVSKMRYTRTERTESAFTKFHNGELPEKDFLEFVLNSDELEYPGDGDCDVQNSVFTLLSRYAGIPAKIDFVYTDSGAGHGPATVFLPGIGWVIMDSMGERTLVENIGEDEGITDNSEDDQVDEHKAQQELLRILERRQKFEELGCSELQ